MPKKSSTAITATKINEMIVSRDFSPVEGCVPEFIAAVLNVSAPLMQQVLKCALENDKIRQEINKHIHETSKAVATEYAKIAAAEQHGLTESNKQLGAALNQLAKIENPSPDQVSMYFETLRAFTRVTEQMTESRQQAEQFLAEVQEREKEAVARRVPPFLKAAWEFAQTPEGTKVVFEIGKALLTAFAKSKR